MKKLLLLTIALVATSIIAQPFGQKAQALSGAEFQPGRIIDDSKFFTGPTMSINDIQAFLNAKVPVCDTWGTQPYAGTTRAAYSAARGISTPFTCLKDARDTVSAKSAESGLCNGLAPGSGTAAEIIYWVGQSCGVNSQVLLVLLQKEQSLVTDDWPWPIQYRSATGYGCPDTAACDSQYYGFFNQVWNAARQFKRYVRDANLFNYRAGVNNYIQYNPNAGCGGSNVFIQNSATAALYNFTPYQPNPSALANLYGLGDGCGAYGNRNFWRLFNDWFGSVYGQPDLSCRTNGTGVNVSGEGSGARIVANKLRRGEQDLLTLAQLNNSGTGCVEAHTWTPSLQQWLAHVPTNRPSARPSDSDMLTADVNGDGRDDLILVEYRNTSSGKIQIHVWDDTYQKFVAHIATPHNAVDPAASDVISADYDGDGKDELFLVKYQGTSSGRVEVHGWTNDFRGYFLHAATNYTSVSKAENRVIAADTNGDRRGEFYIVNYTGTGSGAIEIHGWANNFQGWFLHAATNHDSISPGDALVTPADLTNDGRDDMLLIKYQNTGSGRMEVHGWQPGYRSWFLHLPLAQ